MDRQLPKVLAVCFFLPAIKLSQKIVDGANKN